MSGHGSQQIFLTASRLTVTAYRLSPSLDAGEHAVAMSICLLRKSEARRNEAGGAFPACLPLVRLFGRRFVASPQMQSPS